MLRIRWLICSAALVYLASDWAAPHIILAADDEKRPTMHVPACEDFEVDGRGDDQAWQKVEWTQLNPREDQQPAYATRVKMLYSTKGLYILMDGEDRQLKATFEKDYADLWNEDVFEAFLWPDEKHPLYFEYEVSPLGYELPILVPNLDGEFFGWLPWGYEKRRIQKAIAIRGGPQESGAQIKGWTAEIFMPYAIFAPLQNVPPQAGSKWRANFYRMDYDDDVRRSWDWARVGPSFHEFEKFGTLIFD